MESVGQEDCSRGTDRLSKSGVAVEVENILLWSDCRDKQTASKYTKTDPRTYFPVCGHSRHRHTDGSLRYPADCSGQADARQLGRGRSLGRPEAGRSAAVAMVTAINAISGPPRRLARADCAQLCPALLCSERAGRYVGRGCWLPSPSHSPRPSSRLPPLSRSVFRWRFVQDICYQMYARDYGDELNVFSRFKWRMCSLWC